MAEDIVICNWCGKAADPEYDDCFALSCSANCHAPKESDLYHDKCLKSYLRGMPGKNYDPSRKSGFPCPRGYGPKAATAICKGKIVHMGKAMVKAVKAAPPPPQPVRAPPQPKAAKASKPPKAAQQHPAAAPKPKPVVQQQQQRQQQLQPLSSLRSIPSVGSSSSLASYTSAPAGSAAAAVESKSDPLGRNAAAAAAASAKAAKKNAKRAAAKQAKKEQETATADGATAGVGSSSSSAALGNGLGAAEPTVYRVGGGSNRLAEMYVPSDDEDEIDKWMRKQFAATPMPKPYAAESEEGGSSGSSSGTSSSISSVVDFVQQQQQQQQRQSAVLPAAQLHSLEQQQQKLQVHQPPLVLPGAVPVALPLSAEPASLGFTPYGAQPPMTLPQQQQPTVDEDATDEELLALLLSS